VNSLSGYLIDNNIHDQILFSIVMNDSQPNPTKDVKAIIHNIVIILAKYLKNVTD
jgi:D-alanyl-D-alanine carboxypeptidase